MSGADEDEREVQRAWEATPSTETALANAELIARDDPRRAYWFLKRAFMDLVEVEGHDLEPLVLEVARLYSLGAVDYSDERDALELHWTGLRKDSPLTASPRLRDACGSFLGDVCDFVRDWFVKRAARVLPRDRRARGTINVSDWNRSRPWSFLVTMALKERGFSFEGVRVEVPLRIRRDEDFTYHRDREMFERELREAGVGTALAKLHGDLVDAVVERFGITFRWARDGGMGNFVLPSDGTRLIFGGSYFAPTDPALVAELLRRVEDAR